MDHPRKAENPTYVEQNDVFRSLNGLLREGVFRSIPKGNLLFSNLALTTIFGYKANDSLRGKPILGLFADEAEASHLIDSVLAGERAENVRILFKKMDGANFWGVLTCKKVRSNGRLVLDGSISEVTDLRKAEDQLKDAQIRVEKISAELDRFVYSASHNIRSPITSMKGLLHLMKNENPDGSWDRQYVPMLEESLAKLEQYVDELAGFAKASHQLVTDKVISPDKFMGSLIQGLGAHPNFALIKTQVTVKDAGVFSSDPERLHTVLHNIIKNSFDYCDSGKTERVVAIDFKTEPDKAVVEVFDNGIGIASSSIDRVFDMFYRATNLSKGPGFGLYIAREAAAKLGGTVSLHSEYGVGTSVRLEVPNSKKGKLISKKKLMRA